jgi:hypothetical protein
MNTLRSLWLILRGIDRAVALFTTRLLLLTIGGAAVVGFFASLRLLWFVAAAILLLSGWSVLYFAVLSVRSLSQRRQS